MAIQSESIFSFSPNIVIAGQIDCAIRATGDILSTGLVPTGVAAEDPAIKGDFKEVKHVSVGIMSYGQLSSSLGMFSERDGLTNADQHPWNTIGAVGLDAIFAPYDNSRGGDSSAGPDTTSPYLPHFEEPTSNKTITSKTLDPFNPFNLLAVEGKPYTSGTWHGTGHNISMALNYNPYDRGELVTGVVEGGTTGNKYVGGLAGSGGIYPSGIGRPVDLVFEKDYFVRHRVERSGIRAVGFKAPMVLSGWGYDTNGNAVPSSGGALHPEAAYNPNVWKTGPVDLRWDDARKVWTGGGGTSAFYLCKVTNTYNPTSFSFEVDRSRTRDQYTRSAPTSRRELNASDALYDPEYVAYYANSDNIGQYESLDYGGVEFPYYEAFIIRDTTDTVNSNSYYNIWTEDCSDCGVIQNQCGASGSSTFGAHSGVSTNKKILIENPLRQALDTGDLCFTISTGRSKNVNTGTFSGGSGCCAVANLVVGPEGSGTIQVVASGSGYATGGFALTSGCDMCANVTLYFEERTGTEGNNPSGLALASGTVDPSSGFKSTGTCPLQIIPSDATADTESLPIHWIQQAEFKSQQIVTHVECGGGVLQACTMKIQTQGFKTCEHCGEDTAFINAY